MSPNLFSFATSELSQDAFIAWLASWADKKYCKHAPELNMLARKFLESLGADEEVETVTIILQHKKIDLLIDINEKTLILIEDKTWSSHHGNQLNAYRKAIQDDEVYSQRDLKCIYFKTADQANFDYVQEQNYQPYTREQFLEVLNSGKHIQNDILIDYVAYLQSWDDKVQAYENLPFSSWNGHAWIGFYVFISSHFEDVNFGYVSNPSGGFEACWLGLHNAPNFYFQIGEKNRVSLRITGETQEETKSIKEQWSDYLYSSLHNEDIKFDKRYIKLGKTMALAHFDDVFLFNVDGVLDKELTIGSIRNLKTSIEIILARPTPY